MKFLEALPRSSNSAADTGTAMHLAASHWHKHGKEEEAALAAMRQARDQFPMADLSEAERIFRAYAQDQTNQDAQIVACEALLQGEIGGVVFEGTVDQIRETSEGWEIWDIKTSKFPGHRIRDEHTYQLCAYAVLASKRFARPVKPGGIIMARGYPNPDKVFYRYSVTVEQAELMMRQVVTRVLDVRKGNVPPIPGDHCGYCVGVRTCLARHERTI